MEPDIREGGEARQTRAVVRTLDDPVGVESAESLTARDGDGVGVPLADVGESAGGMVSFQIS